MAKLYELVAQVKYKGKPHKIGEKIEIDEKDLEFFKARKLISANVEGTSDNDPPKGEKPLNQKNAAELKAIAEGLGIDGFSNMTKTQLVDAIQAKQANVHFAELQAKASDAGIDGWETMTEEELLKALGE